MMTPFRSVSFALLLAAPTVALAGTKEDAEHTRLQEEMRRLAGRDAWRGVEAGYTKMLALEKKGVVLSFDDHYLGAQAASNLGNINQTYTRLRRAREVATGDEVARAANWLSEIESGYGPVSLTISPRVDDAVPFDIAEMPFNPEYRTAFTTAKALLERDRQYEGLLPLGEYTFGGQTFTIEAGGGEQALTVGPATPERSEDFIAFIGPRLDLGGSFSSAGEPSTAGEPAGFSGAGLRAGLGLEVGFRGGFGALLQVGYHSIAGGEGDSPTGVEVEGTGLTVSEAFGLEATDTSLRAGYTWLAAVYRPNQVPLSVAFGPVYSIGAGVAQGGADGSDEDLLTQFASLNGQIRAGGVSAAIGYVPPGLSVGNLGFGVSALGGAQTDASRWYQWAQLALTVTPVRREG
ncbi:MAG: hypothetical protein AAFV53_15515 [Myxococcota bacterium]